jgi:PAS domain-containing protein
MGTTTPPFGRAAPTTPPSEDVAGHPASACASGDHARVGTLVNEAAAALERLDEEIGALQTQIEGLLLAAPPLAVVDDEGIVRAWSRAMEEQTGLTADRVLGRRWDSTRVAADARARTHTTEHGPWKVVRLALTDLSEHPATDPTMVDGEDRRVRAR